MAFSVTVKSPMKKPERISRSLGVFAGQVTVASYATTLVECSQITKYFVPITHTNATAALFPHGVVSCVADPVSDSGISFRWDATTGAWQCFKPTTVEISGSASGANITVDLALGKFQAVSTGGAGTSVDFTAVECITDDEPGVVNFVAIGFIR